MNRGVKVKTFLLLNKYKNLAKAGVFVFLFAGFTVFVFSFAHKAEAAACVAGASGNWSNTTTVWTGCAGGGNTIPQAGDTITINSGVALVVDVNTASVGNITITADAGASGTNRVPITINTGVTLTSTGTLTFNGPTTTTNTSTITISGTGTLVVGALTFGTGATNRNITLAVGTGTLTVNGALTVGSGGTRSITTTGAATLNWNGTTIPTGFTWTMNAASTTNFTGTSAINGAYTFGIVEIDSGTTTLGAGTITFAGTTLVRDSATLRLGGFAATFTGSVTLGSGGAGATLNCPSGATCTGTKTFSSGITVNANSVFDLDVGSVDPAVTFNGTAGHTNNGATFKTGTGTHTLSGTGAFPIAGNGAMTYGATLSIPTNRQISVTNTNTVTLSALTMATAAAANSFTIGNGSNVVVTNALTFSANASATTQKVTLGSGAGAGNLTVGSISMTGGSGANAGGGKITCSANGTGTLTVSGAGAITITGSSTASNTGSVSIDMSPGACNVVTGTTATTLTLAGGTTGASPAAIFKMGTGTATLNGALAFSGATANKASFNMGSNGGTLVLNGGTLPVVGTAGSYTFTASTHITSTGTSAIQYATAISTIGTLTVNSGTLTFSAAPTTTSVVVASGATLALGANLLTNTGNLTCGSGGSGTATISGSSGITMSGASASMTLSGGAGSTCNISNTGTFTISGATAPSFAANSNYTIAGAVTISNAAATVTNNGTVSITGTLTLTGAWTQAASSSLTLASATPFSGAGTFTSSASSNTVSYTGNGTTGVKATTYHHLNLKPSSTSEQVLPSGTITVNGDLTIGNGTNAGANAETNDPTITVAGNFTISNNATFTASSTNNLSVGGNWSLGATGAGFTAGTGTVVFTATDTGNTIGGTMTGSNAFYNLTFNGSGGDWYFPAASDQRVTNTLTVTAGTFKGVSSGSWNIYINNGLVGNGIVDTSAFGGAVVVDGDFGGNTGWIFGGPVQTFVSGAGGVITATGSGSFTFNAAFTLTASTTYNAGSKTHIFTKTSGTPFDPSAGAFNSDTSIFRFTSEGAITIARTTYYDLESKPTTAVTHSLGNGGTLTISHDFTIGTGGVASTVDAETSDPVIVVTRDFIISSSAIYSASSTSTLTIGRNFTNGGTFNANAGETIFNTSANTTVISGATTFNKFTVTTSDKAIQFTAGQTFTINGLLTLTGTSGHNVTLNSTTGSSSWTINHQGTESITYTTVTWGACHGSSTSITMTGTGNVDGTHNGVCWVFPVTGITVSGTVYLYDGTTPDTTGYTIYLSNGGGIPASTTSNGSGVFSFTGFSTPSSGNILTLWIGGGASFGTLVVKYGTSCTGNPDCTGLSIIRNYVSLDSKNGSNITNSDLSNCDINDGGFGCNTSVIGFDSDGTNISFSDGMALRINGGTTFAPGGTLTTSPSSSSAASNMDGDVVLAGGAVLSMGSNALSIGGDFGMFGSMSFSSGQTTTFTATATGHGLNVAGGTFENVVFNGSGGGWAFSQDKTINGDLTVTAGTLSGTGSLTINGGDISGNGTINLTGGTVTLSGTGNFGGNTGWTFNNLTFGSGSTGTTTNTGSGNITVSSVMTISTSQTFVQSSSGNILIFGATSGTPLVRNGTFTSCSTCSVIYGFNGGSVNLPVAAMTGSNAFGQLAIFTGATVTAQAAVTATAYVGIYNTATLAMGANDLIIGNNSTLTSSSAVLWAAGSGSLSQSATNSTTILAPTSSSPCIGTSSSPCTGSLTGTFAFGDLIIGSGSNTFTLSVPSTGKIYTTDDLTINTSATLSMAASITVNGGDVTGNGTISMTGNTFTLKGAGNFGGNTAWTFEDITFGDGSTSNTTATTGSGSVTVNGGNFWIRTNHVLNAGSKTWILTGAGQPFSPDASNCFVANTSTFSYRNTTFPGFLSTTYYNLDISPAVDASTGAGTGNLVVNNDFTIGGAGNATVSLTNPTSVDINGSVTIGSGDTLTASASASFTVAGNWTNSGTFSNNNGTVTFDAGSTGKTITSGGSAFKNLTFNNAAGGWTLSDDVTISGVLTITAGNLNASSRTITLSGSGTPFVNSGTFTYGTSTVNYTGTSATNFAGLYGSGSTNAYYNLGLGTTADANSVTYTAATDFTVNNVLTVSNASSTGTDTLDINGIGAVTFKGSGTPLNIISGKGAINASSSVINYTSATGVTALSSIALTSTNFLSSLVINGSGNFNVTNDINLDSNLTITSGTLTGNGSVSMVGGGNVSGAGTINMTGGTFLMDAGASMDNSTNWTFYDLTFGTEKGYGYTMNGTGSITVSDILTLTATDTLDAGTKTWILTRSGAPFVSSGIFAANTSTFRYTGSGSTTIAEGINYYNLEVKPGANGATHTLPTDMGQVTNNLVLGDGSHTGVTVTGAGQDYTLSVGGDVTISANTTFIPTEVNGLSVGGNWTNSGTFTHNSQAVSFTATSGTKTINNGSSPFYDVAFNGSGGTFQFTATTTIAHNLTVTAGTLSGTSDITVGGSVTGAGTINLTGGTLTQNVAFSPTTFGSDSAVGAFTENLAASSAFQKPVYKTIYDSANGKYVMIGSDSSGGGGSDTIVRESTNLTSWTPHTVSATNALQVGKDILYDSINGRYLITEYNNTAGTIDVGVWESTNLSSWTYHAVTSANTTEIPNAMIYDSVNGKYIVIGTDFSDALLWESTDLSTWTQRTIASGTGNQTPNTIIYDSVNGKYVVGGYDPAAGNNDAVVWESTNLTSWTARTVASGAGDQRVNSIIYDSINAKYVAVGQDSASSDVVWESTNLISWTPRTVTSAVMNSVIYDGSNAKYLVAGYTGSFGSINAHLWASSNLTSWTDYTLDSDAGNQIPTTVIYNNAAKKYVVGGYDDAAFNANDPTTWSTTLAGSDYTFNNLTFSNATAGDKTVTVGGNLITVNGTLTVGNAGNSNTTTLDAASIDLVVPGSVTITSKGILKAPAGGTFSITGNYTNNGTFTHNYGTVTFNATSTGKTLSGTLNGSSAFYNLNFNGSGGGWSNSSAMLASGNLTVTTGTLSGTNNITVNGGSVAGNGTINMTGGTFLVDGGGYVGSSADWTFNNLTFGDGTGATTSRLTGAGFIFVTNAMNVATNQTLDAGSKTVILNGNGSAFVISGTFTPSTSTIAFNPSSTSGTTVPSATYYNLTLNKASNTFTASDAALTVNNDLTISNGTFVAPGGKALTIKNTFTNNGTFTANGGEVVLSPQAANNFVVNVNGSSNITFFDLTNVVPRSTIQFKSGRTYAISDLLTITGNQYEPIWLTSDTLNSQWTVTLSSASLTHVNIRDAACSGGSTLPNNSNIHNQGNNGNCWGFYISSGASSAGGEGAGSGSSSGAGNGGGSGGGGASGGGAGGGSSSGGGNGGGNGGGGAAP